MKRLTIIFFALLNSILALADLRGICDENLTTWKYVEETGTLTISGKGEMMNTHYYNNEPYPWNSFISSIQTITIEDGVTTIANKAFANCTRLTSISIPNSVTTIGSSAFRGCTGLTSIEIPNSVTTIYGSAFLGCTGLTSIEIPNSVTTLVVCNI